MLSIHFCGPNGCLLTNDSRVAPHITPYACERGHIGENAVITTNMQMPQHPGFRVPNPNICDKQGNGYYVNPNRVHPHVPSQPHAPSHSQCIYSNIPNSRNQQIQIPILPAKN